MSAKKKPQQGSKARQNTKIFFRPCSVHRRADFSSFKLSSRENCNNTFKDADCSKNKNCAEDSDYPCTFEERENAAKSQRSKKGTVCAPAGAPKKKSSFPEFSENSAKTKHRKEPLPMKMRAFPQSFWQQPNKTPSVSPGTVYCLPGPLSKEENSPENREPLEEVQPRGRQEVVSEPNIDLLFSLFRNVEEEQRRALGQRNAPIIRRGRPKKTKAESKVLRDDDPYLTSSAAESLLPLLPVRSNAESLQSKIAKEEQILAMVSIDGSSSTLLPPVNSTNQNYSQILSELVVQL